MAKNTKKEVNEDEAIIMERMNEALKKMMNTPPETHAEMVKRRRGQGKPRQRPPGKKRSA